MRELGTWYAPEIVRPMGPQYARYAPFPSLPLFLARRHVMVRLRYLSDVRWLAKLSLRGGMPCKVALHIVV